MTEYRFFYWTEVAEHIAKIEVTDCADDDDATGGADSVLRENPAYLVVEIWQGDRLVKRRNRVNNSD